ncbi:MAG: lysophospholipid acyltransferase family protein [Planctomycetota bacterium]
MNELFYKTVRAIGRPIFWCNSRYIALGVEHIPASGACLIASNHTSPYDIALMVRHCPRAVDFVSIVEVFKNPFLAWFYGNMNAFPLDRNKPDSPAVRIILDRLERGRIVVMFPEGGFRRGNASVVHSGKIKSGIGRIASIAKVPVVPAMIINSSVYSRPVAWFPLFRTRYAVAFAPPISPELSPQEIESAIVEAMRKLHDQAAALLPANSRVL